MGSDNPSALAAAASVTRGHPEECNEETHRLMSWVFCRRCGTQTWTPVYTSADSDRCEIESTVPSVPGLGEANAPQEAADVGDCPLGRQ